MKAAIYDTPKGREIAHILRHIGWEVRMLSLKPKGRKATIVIFDEAARMP